MGNDFYDNDFEKYLKEEADDYRMYPSDQVWRNIQQEIHGYRKWPALGVISIFIISALLIGTVLVKPHTQPPLVATTVTDNNTKPRVLTESAGSPDEKKYLSHAGSGNIIQEPVETTVEKISGSTSQDFILIASSNTAALQANSGNIEQESAMNSTVIKNAEQEQPVNIVLAETTAASEKKHINEAVLSQAINNDNNTAFVLSGGNELNNTNDAKKNYLFNTAGTGVIAPFIKQNTIYHQKADFSKTHFEYKYLFADLNEMADIKTPQTQLNFGTSIQNNRTSSPFSKFSSKKSNFDFQFYVTPSISYRRLIDDHNGELSRSYITALPFAANYVVDINNVVQHKPAAGYELGFSLGYNLNSKFAIRSGLQFNMRQYNISAFVHGFEPAAPSLLTGIAIEPNSITGFRNITESEPIVLKNRYYEISLPVGIDWRLINKKLVWGIAASVQPTYTFDKEPFIVTTNYKNYKDGSQLIRNWNVNVGFETYIGYNTGKYRWQLGPQIRTQLLPSLSSSYPIREYPVDYGIKLSLIRSLK